MGMAGKLERWKQRRQEAKRWKTIARDWPKHYRLPDQTKVTNRKYAIGITTYLPRLDTYLKPLIQQLYSLFPDTQIIVSINGYHDQEKQREYLNEIGAFLKKYPNVQSFEFMAPEGLCKLWNGMIRRSQAPRLFIFNDDIETAPELRQDIEQSGILAHEMAVVNGSWSHFMISKACIGKVGWFDERFPGIGYEDHDFEIRATIADQNIERINFRSLNNLTHQPEDYSWGDDHRLIFNKYSGVNGDHYEKKWEIRSAEEAGFTYVEIVKGWVKLQEGMQTPDFYPKETRKYSADRS